VWSPAVGLIAIATFTACASVGGGLYESLVLDPVWPGRPAVIQPRHGGVSRRRFWIPVHSTFEVALVAALVVSCGQPGVRTALLVALVSHLVMRVWSFIDLIPKAAAFEKTDPARVDRAEAERWARRSLLRLPLDAIACAAGFAALVAAA
jgi:hypothetical protein